MTVMRLVKSKHSTNSIWNLKLFTPIAIIRLDLTHRSAQGYVKKFWRDSVAICVGLNRKYRRGAGPIAERGQFS